MWYLIFGVGQWYSQAPYYLIYWLLFSTPCVSSDDVFIMSDRYLPTSLDDLCDFCHRWTELWPCLCSELPLLSQNGLGPGQATTWSAATTKPAAISCVICHQHDRHWGEANLEIWMNSHKPQSKRNTAPLVHQETILPRSLKSNQCQTIWLNW